MPLSLLWAILAGAVLSSLGDWVFAGVLFHERYSLHPEIWRGGIEGRGQIILAQLTTLITAAAFAILANSGGATDLRSALQLAVMIWLAAPLPLLITNLLFIKIDWLVTASHAVGWLVKLLLCGLAVAIFFS